MRTEEGSNNFRKRTSLFKSGLVTQRIPVANVKIAKGRRPVNKDKVKEMASAFEIVGQRQPITVRRGKHNNLWLVNGRHRLAAAKRLHMETIVAFVIKANKSDAELCEGVENLFRAELSPLDKAIAMDKMRKALVTTKHGEKVAGGQQPSDVGINKLARLLGVGKADIQRAMKIGKIELEAKIEIVKQQLDGKQNALLTIAKEPTLQAQLAKIKELAAAKKKRCWASAPQNAKSIARCLMSEVRLLPPEMKTRSSRPCKNCSSNRRGARSCASSGTCSNDGNPWCTLSRIDEYDQWAPSGAHSCQKGFGARWTRSRVIALVTCNHLREPELFPT